MKSIIKYIYTELTHLKPIIACARVMKSMPRSYIFWYVFLVVGISIVLSIVAVALYFSVSNQSNFSSKKLKKQTPILVNTIDINKSIDVYTKREKKYAKVLKTPVQVIDPGK